MFEAERYAMIRRGESLHVKEQQNNIIRNLMRMGAIGSFIEVMR